LGFGKVIEGVVTQQLIQPRVEWMTASGRQICGGHPHRRLLVALTFPIAMVRILVHRVAA
jgi:hypothetical protein